MIERVFVYGTLKPNYYNYYIAQKAGVLDFEEGYIEGYSIYDLRPENYPALVPGPGRVYGSVLRFADIEAALTLLDELECINDSPPLYSRRIAEVEPMGVKAWTYIYEQTLARPGVRLEPSGIWEPSSPDKPSSKVL